jgi:hypothetical protein
LSCSCGRAGALIQARLSASDFWKFDDFTTTNTIRIPHITSTDTPLIIIKHSFSKFYENIDYYQNLHVLDLFIKPGCYETHNTSWKAVLEMYEQRCLAKNISIN